MAAYNHITWTAYVEKITTLKGLNVAAKMLHSTRSFVVPQLAWKVLNDKATALNCYYLRSAREYRKSHHPKSTTSNEQTI